LAIAASNRLGHHDCDFGGRHLASFVFAIVHDPLDHDPHVDRHPPFPPFWL